MNVFVWCIFKMKRWLGHQAGVIDILPLLLVGFIVATTIAIVSQIGSRQEVRNRAATSCDVNTSQQQCTDVPGCRWESYQVTNTCSGAPPCQSSWCTIKDTNHACDPGWIDNQCQTDDDAKDQ